MSDDLMKRVQQLEDRAELGELITHYALAVDDKNLVALAELFTHDCIFDSVQGVVSGRDKVIDYYAQRIAAFGPTFHVPHRQVLEFDGEDDAHGTVLAHAELAIDGTAYAVALRYHDRYRRETGQWRFHERQVSQLYAMPLTDLPDGLASDLRKRWPGAPPEAADWPDQSQTKTP